MTKTRTSQDSDDLDEQPPANHQQGRIQRLTEKGFGFIRTEEGQDYFFHRSELIGDRTWESLHTGELVTFLGVETPKGLRANSVRGHSTERA